MHEVDTTVDKVVVIRNKTEFLVLIGINTPRPWQKHVPSLLGKVIKNIALDYHQHNI